MATTGPKKILWSVLIVAVAAAALYLVLHKKAAAPVTAIPAAPAEMPFDWNARIPDITTALAAAFPDESIGERDTVSIVDTADLDGDGIPEALADMGTGGASTDEIALVSIKGSAVTVAEGTDAPNALPAPIILVQGSAVLHSDEVGMDPTRHLAYQAEKTYNGDDGSLDTCTIDEYIWSPESGTYSLRTLSAPDASDPLWASYCGAAQQ